MEREMGGGECEFLKKDSKATLRSCGFGSRKTRGREPFLHSHLNEGFALDWAVNNNRDKLWARRFTAITDCYGLRFILSYDGPNPVVLRLQMRLMLWAMDLHHRNADWLVSPDYFSRLGVDMRFDPLTREYVEKASEFRRLYAPVTGPMRPETMPGYREPKICSKLKSTDDALSNYAQDITVAPIMASILHGRSGGHESCLQVVPILTGHLTLEEQKSMKPLFWYRSMRAGQPCKEDGNRQ